MAQQATEQFGMSIHLACIAFSISETCYRYEAKLSEENEFIADWLIRLTHNQKTGDLGCAICSCATSKATSGITSVCIASTGNWS